MNKNTLVTTGAAIAAAGGLALGGAALANADQTPTPTTSAPSSGSTGLAGQPSSGPAKGNGNTDPSKPMRSAAKVTAAVKAKEPNATIQRVETDSDGVYEAHMVRSDGTHIIVQVDASFAVTNVQQGPGRP